MSPTERSDLACARCGSPITAGATYCGHCGLPVTPVRDPSFPAPPPAGPSPSAPAAESDTDVVSAFVLGADLVRRYPAMVLPPLIAMAFVFVVLAIFFGSAVAMFGFGALAGRRSGIASAALGSVVLALVCGAAVMLIHLVSSAVVVVMAREALAGRPPAMGAAYGEVLARLGAVVGASVLGALIIGIASLFLFIPGLVAAFFLMFALPAVLLERLGPVDGLKRSAALVGDNAGRAFGLVVGAVLASVGLWFASLILHALWGLGHLISSLLASAFMAYLTVVAVRVFQTLPRGRAASLGAS